MGRVLLAGGFGPQGALSSAEIFDPVTGTFGSALPFDARAGHTATLLHDGKVLIAGGTVDDWFVYPSDAYLFDAVTGEFSFITKINAVRANHTDTLLPNGQVLIAGGDDGWEFLDSAEQYDPATSMFLAIGHMTTGRSGHTATLLQDGRVLITGSMYEKSVRFMSRLHDLFNPYLGGRTRQRA